MSSQPKIFIFSGEHSGDKHGAKLIQSLRDDIPNISISAVAGPNMRNEGVDTVLRMEDFMVMGFTDVLLALPKLVKLQRKIKKHILSTQPDGVILIDYPEFNILLAKALRKKGYKGKIIQYISPTVWAWRAKRADAIARHYDLLLTIYPFETSCYAHTNLDVKYVGNPVKEHVREHQYQSEWHVQLALPKKPTMGLFPGSRKSEILRNLPKQLQVAEKLKSVDPHLVFGISCTDEAMMPIIHDLLRQSTLTLGDDIFLIPRKYTYELMKDCRCALAKSGTITLELALHHTPTVVIYDVSRLNKLIAKYLLNINLPFYCIVNILAGEEVFPETVEHNIHTETVFSHCKSLLYEEEKRNACITLCKKVDSLLADTITAKEASRAIKEIL